MLTLAVNRGTLYLQLEKLRKGELTGIKEEIAHDEKDKNVVEKGELAKKEKNTKFYIKEILRYYVAFKM